MARPPGAPTDAERHQGRSGVRNLLVALGIAVVVVAADQIAKSAAVAHLGTSRVHLWGPLGLALGYNSGSAFSLFTGQPVLLACVATVIVAALVLVAWRTTRTVVVVALGLILGGALGNLADRLFRGHHGQVVDFVTLTHWPTFNVADACIVAGAALLVLSSWTWSRRPSPPSPGDPEGGSD
jgi:signal peptidase II